MNKMRMIGLVAAPFTAFNSDFSLNLGIIEQQAHALIRAGVKGAFVCGTTGEGASMTVDERMQVAQRWSDVVSDDLKVIVHAGDNCQGNACALAAHAQEIGATAVGAMAPYFFKSTTATQIVDFLAPIADAASSLPFYYYHIPSMTGIAVRASSVVAAAASRIPNFAGVKFTDNVVADFRECVTFQGGRFDALFGRDECLLDGLNAGAEGAIGSTYNFAAGLSLNVIRAFEAENMTNAVRLQAQSAEFIRIVYGDFGGLPASKALMAHLGIDCGPVRPPLNVFTKRDLEALLSALASASFEPNASEFVYRSRDAEPAFA